MLSFAILQAAASLATGEPSVQDVAWLAGEWDFSDAATVAAGFSYEEKGTRTCALALDDKYIRCESRGTSRGRSRTYVFYLNYNQAEKRFEMMSMWGNVPHKALYYGTADDGGRTIRLRSAAPSLNDDGVMVSSWAVIRYDGSRSYEWSSGSAPEGAADQGEVRFRDVATRKSG